MKKQIFTGALLGLVPSAASAAGYYLPNQDAFATARGNAFVATADSAAAVFYNPAGMTQIKKPEAQVGVYSIVLGNDATVLGEKTHANDELQAAPHVYYAQPYNDRLSYGFGLNSPFGLGTDWGRNNNFSPVVTEARLLFVSATSAVAYKVTDQLSLGASFSVNYADLTLEQGLGAPGSFLKFNGDDVGFAGAVGARWQPHEQHAFGLTYNSGSSYDLKGKTESNLLTDDHSAQMDFMTPDRIVGGYSYRPAPGWNIEANVEWLNWDSLNTLHLQTSTVPGTSTVPITFDWKSSFIYELGGSYTTDEGYVFAAGYDLNCNSQPDENFTPGVSDADRSWFNLGFGRKCEVYSWMLAYQFGYSNRTVTGAGGALAPVTNGKYESRHNALIFSWTQNF
ncbi:MAG: outer membrane protein transport protein [Verrucomicrobiota bacterium]